MIVNETDKIIDWLFRKSEDELRIILRNIFRARLGEAIIYHGSGEHGLDIAVIARSDLDPFGKEQLLLIQVKKGKITLDKWRKGLCGQLAELYSRQIPRGDLSIARRILLIVIGELTSEVQGAIDDWNTRQPIPIETLDTYGLAEFLLRHFDSLEELIKFERVGSN